jgi:hypothetical protein
VIDKKIGANDTFLSNKADMAAVAGKDRKLGSSQTDRFNLFRSFHILFLTLIIQLLFYFNKKLFIIRSI